MLGRTSPGHPAALGQPGSHEPTGRLPPHRLLAARQPRANWEITTTSPSPRPRGLYGQGRSVVDWRV
ncbi:hypothetical protein N7486_009447 [Penicillium sp. IBT 16267x]|nr:hypothetical protein N7486_009381 [Penicillium sp. IBT 16267x]KAJ6088126.1 hypothetical protein N7486_009387 [Penicillium sp. IBT 16267x]KAJ6088132.1 hypothetical protein N7486_009393 [Penicillium sp. IBT 16267x]KAJ6088138.1 hypothetical protein N7486_009399 [Penicillium sp. IBT 16267x]KAJ6088144.1 hypothetical protein N7486_009405 [Penicillium sp. IBT 16267x]